jgi:HSP20 family molecular chaperone IbpA
MRNGYGNCLPAYHETRTDATFADGLVEVSVPLPAKAETKVRTVEIHDAKASKTAA